MINCTRLLDAAAALPDVRYRPGPAPIVFWYLAGYPGHVLPDGALTTAQAFEFIEELARMRVPMVTVEGDDLSVRPDIYTVLGRAASRGLRVIAATGHRWVDDRAAMALRRAGVSYVGLNLDPPGGPESEETLLRLFEAGLPAVRALQAAGMPFGIKVTVRRFHREGLSRVLGAMRVAGVPRVAFYQLHPENGDWPAARADRKELIEYLLGEAAVSPGLEVVTEDNYTDGPFVYLWARRRGGGSAARIKRLLEMQGGCGAGRKIVGIGPRGEVHPCPSWWHLSLGNVTDEPLGAIWSGDSELLKRLRVRDGHLKGRCGSCAFQAVCGGCRVRAYRAFGDQFQEDPACYLSLAVAAGLAGADAGAATPAAGVAVPGKAGV